MAVTRNSGVGNKKAGPSAVRKAVIKATGTKARKAVAKSIPITGTIRKAATKAVATNTGTITGTIRKAVVKSLPIAGSASRSASSALRKQVVRKAPTLNKSAVKQVSAGVRAGKPGGVHPDTIDSYRANARKPVARYRPAKKR